MSQKGPKVLTVNNPIRIIHSSHFWFLFGSFLLVWQKHQQKVTKNEIKNGMKNGYCETPGM